MAKNQAEEKKPKVVYNSDGSATVSGVKNMAEASKAVQSSIKQSQEKVRQEAKKTAVDRMWDRDSSSQGVKSNTNQSQKKTRQEAKKTAVDKMWDRQSTPRQRTEEDEAASALVKARRNTEQKKKELEDYQNTEYDWTDAAARELYEKGQKQKEAEVSKAQAEQNAAVANFDRAQMNAMSEEDRGLIDEYIRREDTASDPMATGTEEIVEHFVNKNAGIDENRLKQLVETRRREMNAQRMQETQGKAQEEVNDGWMSATWENLKTVPANLISGAMGTMDTIHGLFNQDDRYSGLDPNSMGNQLNVYSGAVRGQTQQNIVGDGSSVVRKGLGALYQGGMSAADTAARMVAGGALGLGAGFGATVAGMNTFSQTMSDASARGATPEQALALAVTTAGIEAATEKVPLDNLIKVSKGGGAKSLIKNILRQAGIEATEEELSLIGTTLADAAIMQEKSEYNLSVAAYMASGMTEEQAREQANWDLIAEAGETAIVSGIAGSIGGFGASATAAFSRDGMDTTQQGTQQAQTAQNQQDANVEGQQEAAAQEDQVKPQTPQEQERAALEATGEELAKNAPKPVPAEPMTEGQRNLENAAAIVNGVQPEQKAAPAGDESGKTLNEKLYERDWDGVGKRNVKAYMYENPEVKPYFQAEAQNMLMELNDSTRGERFYNDDVYYETGGEKGITGVKRHTSDDIAYLLDSCGFTYDQIENGLKAIIEDNGAENNAASKRLEFILHDRLMNGYNDFYSNERVPQSEDYVGLVTRKGVTEYDSAPPVDTQKASAQGGQDENAAAVPGNGQEVPKAEQGQQAEQVVQSEQPVQTDGSTVGMQNAPSGEVKKSKTFTNTGLRNADEDIRQGYQETLRNDPTAGDYEVKRNTDTHATAQERTNSPERVQAEYEYLTAKDGPWTAEDVDTAAIAQKELFKAGEAEKFSALAAAKKKALSNMGQAIQAASIGGTMKEASDPMTACDSAIDGIMKMKEGESTFRAKGGKTYEQWQKDMSTEFTRIAVAIDGVEDGDAGAMRDIIRQIARDRKTTAWFGASERMTHNANRILSKLDFADLKKIANTQLAAMPGDFKRRSKTEIAMGLRKQSMLTSFKTIARNIAGNSAAGFMDSFSDSAGGQFADVLLSKITGKRTVGSDLTRGKEYVNAAKDAMDFASLCVELNIPIETDVDASYAAATGDGKKGGKYVGKTFRSQGNFAMRALYAYQKYMSYALEVSDKIFEGGTNAAVAESLARINNSGLTDTDIQELAEYTGNRRTFKDTTWTDADGKKHGSALSRKAQDIKKPLGVVGDIAMPFASTPMNVAQAGIDYTVGVGKGITEMAAIVRDAKAGKEISVARQRQAATDFGRGLTGMAMIGLFATAAARGIIAVHNDKDKNKKALEQSEGLSGAQINWSAWVRDLNGESAEWQDGDTLSSLDFLEPFNTQMYLAVELSKEDTMQDVLKAYPEATFWAVRDAFMDSPMVQGITDIADLLSGLKDAQTPEDMGNEIAGYAGDVASSFVPQIVRQTAQITDGYYRDTRGANAAEYAKNNFLNAIPGASETLPKKVNGFGQEQERLGWVSTFFDPTNTQKYQKNEISGYLEELSGKTGDMSVYPERQAPMKITVGGEEIQLTGEQREKYQITYGEKLDEYYRGLTESGDFERLTDEQKTAALKQAEEYATQHAKAAVSDFEPVKKAHSEYYAKEITAKQTVDSFTDIFKDGKIDADKLEDAYQQYDGMSSATQKQIIGTAGSQTRAFLEVRDQGVPAKKYSAAAQNIANVKGTGAVKKDTGKATVRDIDVRQAIANTTGMTDREIDIVMRAYMEDYDPEAKSPSTTEFKYQYIREELGLSPDEYASTYRAYLDSSKKAGKIAAIRALGYDYRTAKKLYDVYYGNMKKQLIKMYG